MKKNKIRIIAFSIDGERNLRCDREGCILTTPFFILEMKKVEKGYLFKRKELYQKK